ncbi:hypothetical protein CRM22_003000 [Opisthorchis felineus]|nr:hypothetical protein CRM22_003000 [Opisthorchis felineus]
MRFLSDSEKRLLLDGIDCAASPVFKREIRGYPQSPLVYHVASFLTMLMLTGHCPTEQTPRYEMFEEGSYHNQRITAIEFVRQELIGAAGLWKQWTVSQKAYKLNHILSRLRRRGFLDLLQLRNTTGSVDRVLVPRHRLIEACQELNNPPSKLTVCGRALDKHTIRDSSGWWGQVSGTEEKKNEDGLNKVNQILDDAMWINIHELPGSIPTLEVRTAQGHGVRFDYEPLRFRGFVEPHQTEGWLNRYRH